MVYVAIGEFICRSLRPAEAADVEHVSTLSTHAVGKWHNVYTRSKQQRER